MKTIMEKIKTHYNISEEQYISNKKHYESVILDLLVSNKISEDNYNYIKKNIEEDFLKFKKYKNVKKTTTKQRL